MAEKSNTNPQPNLPLITRFKLHVLSLARNLYVRQDGSINRRVLSFLDLKTSAPATKLINATTRVSTSDISVDPSGNLWFRLFIPATTDKSSLPLMLYFHGGGFTNYGPNSKTFDDLCTHLSAKIPAVVASVNYRLAPEFRYPTQYLDCYDVVKFIDSKNYDILPENTDLNKCFVAGDSAGGNIAHHITFRSCRSLNEFVKIKIAGLLGVQPFFGGEKRTESEQRMMDAPMLNVNRTDWMWRSFLPEGADRNHPAAHVFGDGEATEDMSKSSEFPRVMVVMGGFDPLKDWQRQYVECLVGCGKEVELVEYPNAFHGFYAFPEMQEYEMLIRDAAKFVHKQVQTAL